MLLLAEVEAHMPRTNDQTPRLRAAPVSPPFHVVLVEPEIPPNTGNVARLCAATKSPLHLVGRLGFKIDEHSVRRAGVDYWHLVDVRQHVNFPAFMHAFCKESGLANDESGLSAARSRLHLFTAVTDKSYTQSAFRPGDALVFGKESVGLPDEMIAEYNDRLVGIPTIGAVRSLNLANAVGIALFEALRSSGAFDATHQG